jgi:Hint domain-containing protein
MASTKNQGQGNDRGGSPSGNDEGHGGVGGHDLDHDHDNDRGHGHSDHDHDAPCYCRGTVILTERGEVRVEDLAIGDMVLTISGEAKPIKWIGKRSYAGQFIAGNRAVLPIVVRAGALAPEIPARDLWLSPRHALLLDGALVPAEHLVNAQTIVQAEAVDQVEYFHIEFEAHEVILAEGAPAESYVECDNRQGFHNAHEFAALYPDDTRASFGYCLPLLEPGMAELAAIRARLFERAVALGASITADPGLHLVADGTIVAAQSVADGLHTFRLDAGADEVWLASRCGVPAELNLLSSDRRCLGVCVEQLVLRDDHLRVEISHSHPSLREGFHEDEEGVRRWTTGMGRIPEHFLGAFAGGLIIEVHCLPPLPRYLLHPQTVAFRERGRAEVAIKWRRQSG